MAQVFRFSFQPGRLRLDVRIGAAFHDSRHAHAEFATDLAQPWLPALIFHRIMQQRRDCFVFVAAVRQHNRRDAEQMPDIRTPGAPAQLPRMNARRIHQCATETRSQRERIRHQLRSRSLLSKRKISKYSQISVTINPNAAYHSIYFGAPAATPLSMKSKSNTRFNAATTTTNTLKAIPIGPAPLMVVK